MELISLDNVYKSYGKKRVLNGISIKLYEDEIVGYLGRNGSGKTTTVMAITGLLSVDSGCIKVLGNNVKQAYNHNYANISTVFDSNGLYEDLSVKQNVRFYLNACNKKLDNKELERLFVEFQINDYENKKVETLSKGMKRKVALVRALSIKPKVLILDEPFDGIDIENRYRIIKIIKEYQKKYSMCIILTTHVMADIEELATKLIILNDGKILVNESIDAFKKRNGATLTDKYLEVINYE